MARFNEILAGRVNRGLQKIFSMKGGPVAPQLASEVQVVHPLRSEQENRIMEGWTTWGGILNQTGAAGNNPTIRLTNDIGTNVIAIVEKLGISCSVAATISINFVNFQPLVSGHVPNLTAGAASGTPLDFRIGNPQLGTLTSVLIMSESPNTNGAGSALYQIQVPANQIVDVIQDEHQELIMGPQSLLNIQALAAASTLIVNFKWRERQLEESERFA